MPVVCVYAGKDVQNIPGKCLQDYHIINGANLNNGRSASGWLDTDRLILGISSNELFLGIRAIDSVRQKTVRAIFHDNNFVRVIYHDYYKTGIQCITNW